MSPLQVAANGSGSARLRVRTGVAGRTHCGLLVNLRGHSAGQVGNGLRDYRDGVTLGGERLAGAGLPIQVRRRSSQRLASEGGTVP
jgi:hypothetical protein